MGANEVFGGEIEVKFLSGTPKTKGKTIQNKPKKDPSERSSILLLKVNKNSNSLKSHIKIHLHLKSILLVFNYYVWEGAAQDFIYNRETLRS